MLPAPISRASSIACIAIRPASWHLIDYKTNQVTGRTLAAVAARYELQMFLYALTAEHVLGRMPEEIVLCFSCDPVRSTALLGRYCAAGWHGRFLRPLRLLRQFSQPLFQFGQLLAQLTHLLLERITATPWKQAPGFSCRSDGKAAFSCS